MKIFMARIYKEDMALIRIKDRHFLAASRSSADNFHPLSLIYIYILHFFEFSTISNDTDP